MPMYVIFQYNVLFMEHGIDCISMHLPDLRLEIHFVPNANSITFYFFQGSTVRLMSIENRRFYWIISAMRLNGIKFELSMHYDDKTSLVFNFVIHMAVTHTHRAKSQCDVIYPLNRLHKILLFCSP